MSIEATPIQDLKLLTEVSQLLTSLDLDSVMRQAIRLMSDAVGATRASIFLPTDEDVDWDHIFLMRDLDQAESKIVMRAVLDEGLAGWVMRNQQAAIVYDTETDSRWHAFPDDPEPVRSVLCVPFKNDNNVLAVLTLVHPEPNRFNDYHLELVTIVANQAAMALRNAQLFHQTQQQQHELEVMLRALPEILIVVGPEGRIMRINDEVPRLLGLADRQSIIGASLNDFISDDQPGGLLAPAWRIIAQPPEDGDRWTFEARDELNNRDYQVVVTTWKNDRNRGYIVIMHDVTTLRDLHRFKDEMLKIVSHDLRNPLSLIISARDMLEYDLGEQPEESMVPRYLDIILQSTERMDNLIEDLLQAETSNQRQIEPDKLVNKVVAHLRPLAERKRQTITLDLQLLQPTTFVADPLLISEALENYLSNAIKYTPRNGKISIHVHVEADQLHFVVEDDGVGIAAEHVPHLFEPYYRPPETREQGYGVGLNLVKTIIERHNGAVWVESTPQVGSKFGFWVPLTK